jgi:hypothetical protein
MRQAERRGEGRRGKTPIAQRSSARPQYLKHGGREAIVTEQHSTCGRKEKTRKLLNIGTERIGRKRKNTRGEQSRVSGSMVAMENWSSGALVNATDDLIWALTRVPPN